MEVLTPTWNPKDKYYSFLLVGATSWVQSTDESFPDPAPTDLSGFLLEFIEKASNFFMTPLTWETLVASLEHTWKGWLEHVAARSPAASQLTWIPTELRISSDEHRIIWKIQSIDSPPVRIPPGFGIPPPIRTVTVVPPDQGASGSQMGIELLEAADEIPFEDEGIEGADADAVASSSRRSPEGEAEGQAATRATARRRLREARLRAELSRLKAERMARHYKEKYGLARDSGASGSDSSLSSDSEI
jgi:hypothetical protein